MTVALTGIGEAGIALANATLGDLRQAFVLDNEPSWWAKLELLDAARAGEQEPDLWLVFAGGALSGASANGAGGPSPIPPPRDRDQVRLGWVLPQDGVASSAVVNWLRGQGFSVFDRYDPPDPVRLVRMAVLSIVVPQMQQFIAVDFDDVRSLMRLQVSSGVVTLIPSSTRGINSGRLIGLDQSLASGSGVVSCVIGRPEMTMEPLVEWGKFLAELSDEIRSMRFLFAPWLLGPEDNALVVIWQPKGHRLPPSTDMTDLSRVDSVTQWLGLWRYQI